jgi:hypothetical protein
MTRTTNARIAGFTFLFYIAAGISSVVLFGRATRGEGVAAKLDSKSRLLWKGSHSVEKFSGHILPPSGPKLNGSRERGRCSAVFGVLQDCGAPSWSWSGCNAAASFAGPVQPRCSGRRTSLHTPFRVVG